jgi:hydrogenase maturation protein HypF
MKSAMTSSMGRLFDAAAAISGLRLAQSYEGQAAMKFEAMAEDAHAMENGFVLENGILDFRPLLVQMAERRLTGSIAASVFHATLIDGLARWAVVESRKQDICQIVLSGGCMMNRRLAEGLCSRFSAAGLRTYLPKAMPANDGGLALGQAVFARHAIENDRTQVEET